MVLDSRETPDNGLGEWRELTYLPVCALLELDRGAGTCSKLAGSLGGVLPDAPRVIPVGGPGTGGNPSVHQFSYVLPKSVKAILRTQSYTQSIVRCNLFLIQAEVITDYTAQGATLCHAGLDLAPPGARHLARANLTVMLSRLKGQAGCFLLSKIDACVLSTLKLCKDLVAETARLECLAATTAVSELYTAYRAELIASATAYLRP